jgi:hypothetical protein
MSEHTTLATISEQDQVEYRDIPGFPGYRAGNDGSIWSCHYRNGIKLALRTSWRRLQTGKLGRNCKYPKVALQRDGTRKSFHRRVHRLILEAFVGPCPEGMEACHEDGDPSNNRPSNLRWDTKLANKADMIRHGRSTRGERDGMAKLSEEDVVAIRLLGSNPERPSHDEIGARYGVSGSTVCMILSGQTWIDVAPQIPVCKRTCRGEKNAKAKINEAAVREIRRLASEGNMIREAIGQLFGITQSAVQHIVKRRCWTHVD